eukprot:TRINITY_DN19625_c0_g1_i4.p1 TRINITY_DN19625_c0_g1~~TRINITY_DN19625_c0_g1_i4.p1  ORF type:complete len:326 (+),score=55.51 TRINITY_DN19625_c0_g1_i4:79-1056(+)
MQQVVEKNSELRIAFRSRFVEVVPYHAGQEEIIKKTCDDDILGSGDFGEVVKETDPATGQSLAIKTVHTAMGSWVSLAHEAEVLRALDHPHLVRLFAWCQQGTASCVVMEGCVGGEIVRVVRAARKFGGQLMPLDWAVTACRQMLEALAYCHDRSVWHLDIKPENILLLSAPPGLQGGDWTSIFTALPHVVLVDFGLACFCGTYAPFVQHAQRLKKIVGTPATMAPEVFECLASAKSDVWSLGCVFFKLLSGHLPFVPKEWGPPPCKEALQPLHQAGPDWTLLRQHADYGDEATDLVQQMLQQDSKLRLNCTAALEHAWIRRHTK